MEAKQPTYGNGKICYLEIPAEDPNASGAFFAAVFGWEIRSNGADVAFDDGVGEVSGMWVKGEKPMTEAGIVISIMVDDADATAALVPLHGGTIVHAFTLDSGEKIVRFTDPAGNLFGMYQSNASH